MVATKEWSIHDLSRRSTGNPRQQFGSGGDGKTMKKDPKVLFMRAMDKCDLSPTPIRIRRKLRKTGIGPAGPSEKALARRKS